MPCLEPDNGQACISSSSSSSRRHCCATRTRRIRTALCVALVGGLLSHHVQTFSSYWTLKSVVVPEPISSEASLLGLPYRTLSAESIPPSVDSEKVSTPTLEVPTILESIWDAVQPRAFVPWNISAHPLPCFHPVHGPDDDNHSGNEAYHWTNKKHVLRTLTTTGLLFVKLLKTASSTSASVHLRLARNLALERNNESNHNGTSTSTSTLDICQTRHLHGWAGPRGYDYRHRDVTRSFVWSLVRDPVARTVSEFFHFDVSRRRVPVSQFQRFVRRGPHANQHQVAWLAVASHFEVHTFMDYARASVDVTRDYHALTIPVLNDILQHYNFLGVAERLDESLVVLSLLLHRPLADVLHISMKASGSYDDGGTDHCVYIQPSNLTQRHLQFLATDPTWLAYIQPEQVLYRAINASLDWTIDTLGRDVVETKVQHLRHAQRVVQTTCHTVALPCTATGVRIPDTETDCLQGDMGCGFDCLDDVATRLDLW